MFPVEILEILFKYSDGADIINFRGVCNTWNEIIVKLSKDTNLWRVKCEREISICNRKSIHAKLYPKMSWLELHQSVDNLIWLTIYQSWLRWCRLQKSEFSKEQFEPFFIGLPFVTITCLSVLENLLAVGSSEGFITFYNIDGSTTEPIFIADQKEYVSTVEFLKEWRGREIEAISLSNMHRMMLWNITTQEVISRQTYGKFMSTTNTRILRAIGSQLTVQENNKERTYDFVRHNGTIVALATDGEQALLWTDVGFTYEIDLNNTDSEYVEQYVRPPLKRVRQYYLFGHWVSMCITEDGILGISVNHKPWKMYNILPYLHGYPTSLLYYASMLVLGLDSGSMHIYHVKDIASLTNQHFCSSNSKAIIIDNQAIILLDIMERPGKQYMIAATSEKVTIIKFRDLMSK
ncbi:uncharacterized protein LOC105683828 isoform X2 [Athalia rosae]|uniref:uncharacterized protein LOC105683828 isoform X2 n=1 Tax=Athalia rosae TaxID=37344 RepID=UPI0020349E78|nr:uncharacterized protein LOC105683828 isoform X2 [Athalia rosae]